MANFGIFLLLIKHLAEVKRSVDRNPLNDRGNLYTTFAFVTSIAYDKSFCYTACKQCKRKVNGNYCDKCGEEKGMKVNYIFHMKISDGTGSLWVNVFGEQGDSLLGVSAAKMKELKDIGDDSYKEIFDNTKIHVKFLIKLAI